MSDNFLDYLLGLVFWGSVIALAVAFDFYEPKVHLETNHNNVGLAFLGIVLMFLLAKPVGILFGSLARF